MFYINTEIHKSNVAKFIPQQTMLEIIKQLT